MLSFTELEFAVIQGMVEMNAKKSKEKALEYFGDILPPPTPKLRGEGFLFEQTNVYSISKLTPCVPRFNLFYAKASRIPSFLILILAL